MPKINWPNRTTGALCRHFAFGSYGLEAADIVAAVKSKLPEAQAVRGDAVYENGEREPCTWVRVGGKDFDVQRMAQNERARLARPPAGAEDMPFMSPRELEAREWGCEVDMSCKHVLAVDEWVCPACPACCGQQRAHTLDDECHSPWKESLRSARRPQAPGGVR